MIDKEINEIRENFLNVKDVVIIDHKKLFRFVISIIKTTLNHNKDIKNTILFRNNIVNMVFDTGYFRVYKYCKRDPYNSKIKALINLCNRNIEKALNGIDLLMCMCDAYIYVLDTDTAYESKEYLHYHPSKFKNMLKEIKHIVSLILREGAEDYIDKLYFKINSIVSNISNYMDIVIESEKGEQYLSYSFIYTLFLIACVWPI